MIRVKMNIIKANRMRIHQQESLRKHLIILLMTFCFGASLLFLVSSCRTEKQDFLKQGFRTPPDDYRPGVYWYFMDGNLSREAMTKDLEAMKKAGLGWALFLEVNVGVPRGKVDFLSEEWQGLFTHAVREAERLGIRLILGSGPGWAGSGGPWVKPEQSMQHLVASEVRVKGPGKFRLRLPVPEAKRPFFGYESLTPELKKKRDGWYQDVAVLAFPAPSVEERIPLIEEKAFYYRAPYTSQPGVWPYLPPPTEGKVTTGVNSDVSEEEGKRKGAIDSDQIINLTDRLKPDGSLDWEVPAGGWIVMRFVARNNGAVTRPAPVPGLGFECDKFSREAFEAHFEEYIGRLIRKAQPRKSASGGGWTMIHIDSWEMGAQNWTQNFREEFRRRRGYDPLPYYPVYAGRIVGSLEESERFLWDLRRTASELIVENHAEKFKELGRKYRFTLSIEPYDMNPAADFDLGAVADVPMGEFWCDGFGFNSSFSVVEATSIGHIIGAPVVAAESFTAMPQEAWKKYPGNMKDQTDWAFCQGLNRLIFHTFVHNPLDERLKPGMTMGPYGVHWDRAQTWWSMVRPYHDYVARCQFVLSQGKTVADILYLTPEGAPQVFRPAAGAMDGTEFLPDKREYSFDGCSPVALMKLARVENGRIVFPGGASYRLMVLPAMETMTPELLRKIEELVRIGAMLVGSPPKRSPSLENYPDCDRRVQEMAKTMWGSLERPEEVTVRTHGQGKIFWGGELSPEPVKSDSNPLEAQLYPDYKATQAVLLELGVLPDFICSSGKIRYTHRSLPESGLEIYFISNRSGEVVEDVCLFRDGSGRAELWDDINGDIIELKRVRKIEDGRTSLPVRLEPHQSFFVVFYKERGEAHKTGLSGAEKNLGRKVKEESKKEIEENQIAIENRVGIEESFSPRKNKGENEGRPKANRVADERSNKAEKENKEDKKVIWNENYAGRNDEFIKSLALNFPLAEAVMELKGPWKVKFDPKWGGPGEVVFERLIDWTMHPDDGIRYYSGTAVYSLDFDLPEGMKILKGQALYLDLGEVHCLARVRLNGRELGIVWTEPPRVRVDSARLKKKGNHLEIEVANLWINRLIGDENEPWDGVADSKWPEWLLKGEPRPTKRFTFSTHRLYKLGDPLAPSGLIGPVSLKTGDALRVS